MADQTSSSGYSIVLAGCGKMGRALLEGWLARDLVARVLVLDPGGLPDVFQDDPRISHSAEISQDFGFEPDVVVLAVKPQILDQVSKEIDLTPYKKTLILSIAAGKTLQTLEGLFGGAQPIVRVMPNTPAAIGKGMSVAVANIPVQSAQRDMCDALLCAAGLLRWIGDESLMDAVTALSGSGPAYVFLLIETLAKAGEKLGLSPDMAMALARQTVIGSAALAETAPEVSAEQLRINVTSPGGTTQAALDVLMDGSLQDVFNRALEAAEKRGKALNA
ncbi:MAG: pyrroline-5-carboxylate reductase [Alphaproteobacteria bacterium]|nr:pyrroline-5-carboxylate reductase [Alphaproteobacteria bacterium]